MVASEGANVILRKVAVDDRHQLFLWRNTQEIIDLSASQSRVTWKQHTRWFDHALALNNPLIYIIMDAHSPIGQVRFDLSDQTATISIYLIGENKGKGRGAFLITAGIKKLKSEASQITEVLAFIRSPNERSVRSFVAAGFKRIDPDENSAAGIRKFKLNVA